MKVAVIVYGEFREFDTLIKYWDFLDKIDYDLYFSTWDYSFQENKYLNIKRERNITEDMVKEILPNSKFSILKLSEYTDKFKDGGYQNAKKVTVHLKNLVKMMRESEKKYDLVITTRTDNFTVFNLNNITLNEMSKKSDVLYGLQHIYISKPHQFFVEDLFFISNYDNICKLIDNLPDDMDDLHHYLAINIINSDLYVEQIGHGLDITTFRPNCLDLGNNLDFHKVANKHVEWSNTEML